jgi:histidinol-phosphate phosphatase family protein
VIDIVVPTIGRPSLAVLLASIVRSRGPRPDNVIVVDDRRDKREPLPLGAVAGNVVAPRIVVLPGEGRGPAAARNVGYRASHADWIAFVDDDVVVDADWLERLADDLRELPPGVAGSTGRVCVPLASDRKSTDWERNVAGLERAQWITADCAYRRGALAAVGGFDERFERAFREDADLALRLIARGWTIVEGRRSVAHPVRPAPWNISITLERGNADDVLMDALHGRTWRRIANAPLGAYPGHLATVACAAIAAAFGVAWAALSARFAWRRIAPGPRDAREIATMLVTSLAIPFAAVFHRLAGRVRLRALLRDRKRAPQPIAAAVLFDRDGTLIVDVPYNADPAAVVPMPGAQRALERLRRAGVRTAVITNQSGVALGKLDLHDVGAINARVEALLGPLGPVFACVHAPDEGCTCRKPAPGLVEAAARVLGVRTQDCIVIGDIGADVGAAQAAGARAILVPNERTRKEEIAQAPLVANDLDHAVRAVLAGAV